jgi:hypothetical protein
MRLVIKPKLKSQGGHGETARTQHVHVSFWPECRRYMFWQLSIFLISNGRIPAQINSITLSSV